MRCCPRRLQLELEVLVIGPGVVCEKGANSEGKSLRDLHLGWLIKAYCQKIKSIKTFMTSDDLHLASNVPA